MQCTWISHIHSLDSIPILGTKLDARDYLVGKRLEHFNLGNFSKSNSIVWRKLVHIESINNAYGYGDYDHLASNVGPPLHTLIARFA